MLFHNPYSYNLLTQIGEILIQHFGPDTSEGHSMRNCYAKLSAQKTSAVDLYKEKCKDKTFREIAAVR